MLLVRGGKTYTKFSSHPEDGFDEVKLQQLPVFNFEELETATSSFHHTKKLGQGGFGPVYRVIGHFQQILVVHQMTFLQTTDSFICIGNITRWKGNSGEEIVKSLRPRVRRIYE